MMVQLTLIFAIGAWALGVEAVVQGEGSLGSGLTWEEPSKDYLNECFDKGANVGEFFYEELAA